MYKKELYERRKESLLNEVSALKNAEQKGAQKKAIEIAKNLLDILNNETIAVKTGLSIQKIENMRNKMNET